MDPELSSHAVFPQAAALGMLAAAVTVLCIPPLVWHIRSHNIAAACLVSWLMVCNLMSMINACIWPNDNFEGSFDGVGLCDIEVEILVARSVALPAATLCILKGLANVMDVSKVNLGPSTSQKRRRTAVDLLFCLGLPLLTMLLHYVVQPTRYLIFGISGCAPSYAEDWLTVLLLDVPPLLLVVASSYYAGLVIYRLRHYRRSFSSILNSANTTKARFLRLLILSMLFILAITPLQIWLTVVNWPRKNTYYSWSQVHDPLQWQLIDFVPSHGQVLPDRWISIGCGALVFVFFGLGQDAKATYRSWMLAAGLGKILPGLCPEERRGEDIGSGSFASRARLYIQSRLSFKCSSTSSASKPSMASSNLTSPLEPTFLRPSSHDTESGLVMHNDSLGHDVQSDPSVGTVGSFFRSLKVPHFLSEEAPHQKPVPLAEIVVLPKS